MNWISFTAMYFVVWWITLFAVLPFGLKTQEEDENVTLGTVASAPRGPHAARRHLDDGPCLDRDGAGLLRVQHTGPWLRRHPQMIPDFG